MKAFKVIVKILAVLAAIAGVVYVVATYGDKLTAWAKELLEKMKSHCSCCCCCEEEAPAEVVVEGPVVDATEFEG